MILETERLYLRRFQIEDAYRMHEYRDKPEVSKYQSWHHYSLKDAQKRIMQLQKITEFHHPHTDYHFAIVLKENDMLIGDIFAEIVNHHTFVLGYTLDSPYWSYGYATEMVSAFIEYMRDHYDFHKVICYAYKENKRSIRLLERLGFIKFNDSFFYRDVGYMKRI